MGGKELLIKQEASRLGFDFAGIARADFLEPEARLLENWLNKGSHGEMAYMANHFDMRTDPRKLVPGAKSVICLLHNYYNPAIPTDQSVPRIARYAYGNDYHKVLRRKLKKLLNYIRNEFGAVNGRVFVDSGPVMERAWAQRSGVGWIGKNTNLINKKKGSWFFLCEIILDLDLIPDSPVKDHCGSCTRCLDACPTGAITEPYSVDANKCISYLTIELRRADLPNEFKDKMHNWAFGCDICQEVCPWNNFAQPHQESEFAPAGDLLKRDRRNWEELTEEVFNGLFNESPLKRTGWKGMKRNIRFLNSGVDSTGRIND